MQDVNQPMLPASVRSRALVAGQLLDFDETIDVVVAKLETARVGNNPAELHVDGRKVAVSPEAARAWVTAWEVNPSIVRAPAQADSLLRPRVAG
jgi:hypothetical protein